MSADERLPTLDLAAIGNSVLSALVDRNGRIVWLCWPRFDGDPVFCSLLDGATKEDGTGFFEIGLPVFVASGFMAFLDSGRNC